MGETVMKQVISIGAQDFETIRENNYFFVDKTDFIREWWENGDSVTLLIRPRRFGKTLNMSMLNCFFSNRYEGRGELFEGLSIWKEKASTGNCDYHALQGTYPVIFLSFADVKGARYEDLRMRIVQKLVGLYNSCSYVSEVLNEKEAAFYDSVRYDMPDNVAVSSVHYLCEYLERYHGRKALIFLDEYDTPLQEAYVCGCWADMVVFIRSLFNSTFKTNPYMARGLMTGITRISKESIFSDMNNLTAVTTTSEMYRTQFGFTEEEVFAALDFFDMPNEKEDVKSWYDGFTFGSQKDVYNPWSITNFLKNKQYRPYWANSSSNALVNMLIRQGDPKVKMIMEDFLAGKALDTWIDEEIVFDQLQETDNAIWSLLLASGYLKIVSSYFDKERRKFFCRLELTNCEVEMMFEDMIKNWFPNGIVPYNNFLKAMLLDDIDYMNEYMNQIADEIFSTFDVGNKPSGKANPERFYHGFVLGLIVELTGQYRITSNRESGLGRYDVMLEPVKAGEKAYILEFKVRNARREATLEDTLRAALSQIEEKNYDAELLSRGIRKKDIRHYGFAFEGKAVLIG